MATRELHCFVAVCDGCGDEYEHDYTPHWPSSVEAVDDAVDGGEWRTDGDKAFCANCPRPEPPT